MSRSHLVLVLLFIFAILPAVPVLAQDGGQAIGACTVIDKPGSYRLARNITAKASDLKHIRNESACILIFADFVTLDLRGYTITGPGTDIYAFGVYSSSSASATRAPIATYIRNGCATNFDRGISVEGSGHTVEGVRVAGNNAGILVAADGVRIKDAVVWGNWQGIVGVYGSGLAVEQCQVHQNSGAGIALRAHWDIPGNPSTSLGSRIVGNTVSGNGEYGIYAVCPSLILHNMFYGNGEDIHLEEGSDCTLADNNPAP